MARLDTLLAEIRRCDVCAEHLPLGPRPVLRAHRAARILIVGQAPGTRVHASGIPWDDPSGDRLREWLGVEKERFYDASKFAIVPMGFCYPGTGKSGDLPPRPECAELWHARLRELLPEIRLTILLSQYALRHYLGDRARKTVTETVRAWKEFRPRYVPLPHPSPRNNRWLKRNPWLATDVLPYLRRRVRALTG
ncbi:MAG: uracil-DNA glycosylase family protein [Planctomycetota bacterium]